MKKYVIFSIFFLATISLSAQYKAEYVGNRVQAETVTETEISTGIQIASNGAETLTTSYFSPSFEVDFTPRLSVEVGVLMSRSNWFPAVNEENDTRLQRSMNQFYAYTSANYQYSPKLTVYGSVLKQIGSEQIYNNPYMSNIQSVSFGFDYQISKNIQVGFQIRKQNHPGFASPFYTPFGY